MPLVHVAESYLEVNVDFLHEAAWVNQPVAFRVEVKNLNSEPEGPFAAVHHMEDDNGAETDQKPTGESSGLASGETWRSEDQSVLPQRPGSHTIAVQLYRDGQPAGSGTHRFHVLEP